MAAKRIIGLSTKKSPCFWTHGLVEVKHDGVCTLIGIGNVTHEIRVNRIAAMTSARIIKVDDIELGLDLISILMVHHVVVGNRRKVGKLEIIDIH